MDSKETRTSAQQPQPSAEQPAFTAWPAFALWNAAAEYSIDAVQRSVLFWDVMRQRGNQYLEHLEERVPNVLSFKAELVASGREMPRPVNYGLVRIIPPHGVTTDPKKRPFVVVDPRAGHGPGIGGFKADSEIGVALAAGHPCYFIGFLPDPVPGQTIEDVANAEAAFLERVIALHPDAESKPAVIANCQAGWAIMILAALRPELFGGIIVAGAPLSYWAGERGVNPMRYTGGLLGGTWLAAATSDLGNGIFDGAWLVQNFESLNPSNTLWTKQYNLYAKVDTEGPRYLGFEKWWGGHVLLTGEEIEFIVDKLFVGNKLSSGEIVASDGTRIDLRNIRAPIVVFCSKGDNITPPQQALGWILDVYNSVDEIRSYGQTIVYAVHESIGHLGIFVSGSVAKKEHSEFASNIDLIDVLPPGLYEAVLKRKAADDPTAAFAGGDYITRFEPRTLDDIHALGGNDEADERRFATVARLSEINKGLYEELLRPWLRNATNDTVASALRRSHPSRAQYELLSDRNPLMAPLKALAEQVREQRRPCAPDNPFLQWQEQISQQVVAMLDQWGAARDWFSEQTFLSVYGSPLVQALAGTAGVEGPVRARPGTSPQHRQFVEQRIGELKSRIAEGGAREAAIRAMLYVGLGNFGADERAFAVLRQLREEHGGGTSLADFKQILREQLFMLLLDEKTAFDAIPEMARRQPEQIGAVRAALRRVAAAIGPLDAERATRLALVQAAFEAAGAPPSHPPEVITVKPVQEGKRRHAGEKRPASEAEETTKA
jgi:pimeloyl-ACP methyl ester carboxylesterase